ncbi:MULTISPECIES: YokU family protein [Alteribacter]|uniref:YokU family protein n=1 Tax=Alteribacter keqinensis TaxID=2483800 RepID=A0A3M7TWF8_9BACI|nr:MULTISPECIES: YokU family protein [Alteribacter]MBM7094555.1 YokU family protein [Alteribacter salitolerans]RNA69232.1 YokU family protein [Alteribacter keqinensis]
MKCKWCESDKAIHSLESAYWELPDGSRAVEITQVPSIKCSDCEMIYIEEEQIADIEDQFMLIDTKKLDMTFSYKTLMNQPKFLKKNYFNFDR